MPNSQQAEHAMNMARKVVKTEDALARDAITRVLGGEWSVETLAAEHELEVEHGRHGGRDVRTFYLDGAPILELYEAEYDFSQGPDGLMCPTASHKYRFLGEANEQHT